MGVLVDEPEANIKSKERLEPGKMFLIDFEQQRIIPDDELKEGMAKQRPYEEWMARAPIRMSEWVQTAKSADVKPEAAPPRGELNSHLAMFGFTKESVDVLISAMVAGKEGLGSMGVDTPLAVLSQQPKPPSHYFKQLFAQVTNPPINPTTRILLRNLLRNLTHSHALSYAISYAISRALTHSPTQSHALSRTLLRTLTRSHALSHALSYALSRTLPHSPAISHR